jgi:CelD/BcsL family acetyltransferase involved in cellulose biosynthesis
MDGLSNFVRTGRFSRINQRASEQCENPGLSAAGIRVVTVRDVADLRPHRHAWDRLAWEAPQGIPMSLPGWIDAGISYQPWQTERWSCSFAYAGDKLVGVLPAIAAPHSVLGANWPVLRTFDNNAQSGDILLAPDHAVAAFKALLMALRREVPTHLGLDLKAVRRNSPFWTAINDGLDGYSVHCGAQARYSFLDVSGDHDAYWASLGNMRYNTKRYLRKLSGRGAVSVDILQGLSAREDFLAEFLALEASGWKGRERSAIVNRPDLVAFYTALIRNFAAEGRLEWHTLRVDGRLVAAQMGLRCGASVIIPKIAYDEEFAACMPGNLLTGEVIKDLFSRPDISELNYLSDADWQRAWRMDQDSYVDVHLVRKDMLPVLLHLPRVLAGKVYQDHVRPRIPASLRTGWRWLMRLRRQRLSAMR